MNFATFKILITHLRENASWPWFFRFIQFGSWLLFVRWWWHIPVPGEAIGVLAVLAAVMSLHMEKMQSWEKAVWVLLMIAFLGLEFKAITEDRRKLEETHKQEMADQAERNQHTIEAILQSHNAQMTQNQNQFEQTVSNLKGIAASARQSINLMTGGDEYCWVVPVEPLSVDEGGNPAYPRNKNWRQIALKNSGNVVLPTCDIHLIPYPTEEEFREHKMPPDILYHFEKVPVMSDKRQYRFTPYYISGDRIYYTGGIETPTRKFQEVIKFAPDPKDPTRNIPSCLVQEMPELSPQGNVSRQGKILEKECFPQKFGPPHKVSE